MIYLYFKDSAFTAVKRDAKFYERGNFSVQNGTAYAVGPQGGAFPYKTLLSSSPGVSP